MGVITCHLLIGIMAGTMGGFQHGYHAVVIANPQKVIEKWIGDVQEHHGNGRPTPVSMSLLWGLIVVGLYCIGGMIGGIITAPVVKYLGRKNGLIWQNAITIGLSSVLFSFCKLANSFEMFVVARFLIGINGGLNSGISPMYLMEISPTKLRGGVSSLYQLMITISILFVQFISLEELLGSQSLWYWALFSVVPGAAVVIQIILFCIAKASPREILESGTEEKARKSLVWFRQKEDVDEEFKEIKAEHDAIKAGEKVRFKDYFTKKRLRTPFIISTVVLMSQQLVGINVVMFYSNTLFRDAGLKDPWPGYFTVILGAILVVATICAVFMVEVCGRKVILLVSYGGMVVSTALMFVGLLLKDTADFFLYIVLVNIFLYVVFFAIGAGPIPWFLVSELFNQEARPIATAVGVALNWLSNAVISATCPYLMEIIGSYFFVILLVLEVIFFVFILFKVPETKNRPIDEIVASFE